MSSEELELLLNFASHSSLRDLSFALGRDHSVVSRTMKRIAEKYPVVEKKAGKWVLTELGRQVNDNTHFHLDRLFSVLNVQSLLRIGTNREFSSRVIAPDLGALQKAFPSIEIALSAYENGTEYALLSGLIDIGIDCDRPNDPEISYKLVAPEPIICVAGKNFLRKYKNDIRGGDYWQLPHLLCERLHPDKILAKPENRLNVSVRFNDIASTRAACIAGVGWALLPRYAVLPELQDGTLIQIDKNLYGNSKYGVWWPRRKRYLSQSAEVILAWLEKKSL